MSEWERVYSPVTILVAAKINPSTIKISKFFYKTIRLFLQGEAASTMDSYTHTHCGRGIEYYNQLKCIFHPLWPVLDHSAKIIAFYQLFRHLKISADTYTATLKRWVSEMSYNGMTYNSDRLYLQFISSLGKGFTQLRNMHTLPPGWQTTDIALLTHTARTYLSTLEANYEMNRSQSAYLKAASAELPPENPQGRMCQQPRQHTAGTPNPFPPTPIKPSPIVPPPPQEIYAY